MFYIQKFEIQGFLGIEKFNLDFQHLGGGQPAQMTVITGPSGSGKTSIATAFMMLSNQYIQLLLDTPDKDEPKVSQLMLHDRKSCTLALEIYSDALSSDGKGKTFGIVTTASGDDRPADSNFPEGKGERVSLLAEKYNEIWIDQEFGVPLIAYYTANRTIYPPMAEGRDAADDPLEEAITFPLVNEEYFDGFFDYLWTARRRTSKIGRKQIEKGLSENGAKKLTFARRQELLTVRRYFEVLDAINKAVSAALPEVTKIRPTEDSVSVHKGSAVYDWKQLPFSEQAIISLIGDIARRDAMLNPDPSKLQPLFGVVFIDDIDLWFDKSNSRSIVGTLCKIFPHIQFIVTASSPDVAKGHDGILVYELKP